MDRFQGSYYHSIDAKNRLFIPAPFRKKLGEGEEDAQFIIMKSPSPEKCLFIYPKDEWELIELKLDQMEPSSDTRKKYRLVYSRIDVVSLDKQGRVVLKEDFCRHANFDKDILVLGSGKRIELWSKEEWDAMAAASNDEDFDWNEIPW